MSDLLVGKAVGLIETRGYAALVAASDASSKHAYVELISVQRASDGLVLIAFAGDVASVQAAVDAGAREAQTVGELISAHVIPRPDESVWRMLGVANTPAAQGTREEQPPEPRNDHSVPDDLDELPVRELRRIARAMEDIGLSGRDISRAPKSELIDAIRRVDKT